MPKLECNIGKAKPIVDKKCSPTKLISHINRAFDRVFLSNRNSLARSENKYIISYSTHYLLCGQMQLILIKCFLACIKTLFHEVNKKCFFPRSIKFIQTLPSLENDHGLTMVYNEWNNYSFCYCR